MKMKFNFLIIISVFLFSTNSYGQNYNLPPNPKPGKIKLIKYQERLVSLDYDAGINGIIDNKTILSHHKYLDFKKKENLKEKKKGKRKTTNASG